MKKADAEEGSIGPVAKTSDEMPISPPQGPTATDPMAMPPTASRPRIGRYEIVRPLVDAPGARLLEARGPEDQAVILQIAHVRAPASESERAAQIAYTRSIEGESEAIAQEPEVGLLEHGAQDEPDGSKTLYWAMAWREGATRLGHAAAHVRSLEHFVTMARQLTERVRDRHAAARFDPLLSYALVLVQPDAGASFVGVPIHLPPEWLAEDIPGAAFAPEETLRRMPTKGGDLWRLGRTLTTLAKELADVPAALRAIMDSLADPDPMLRMASASTALVEFAKLSATRAEDLEQGALADRLGFDSLAGREPIELTTPKGSGSGRAAPAGPVSITDAPTLTDLRSAGVRVAAQAELVARSPGLEAALDGSETLRGVPLAPADTILDLAPPSREQIEAAVARNSEGPTVAVVDRPAADSEALARLPAAVEFDAPLGPGGTVIGLRKGAGGPSPTPAVGPTGTVLGVRPKARDVVAGIDGPGVQARPAPASAITANTVALPVERFSGRTRAGDPAGEEGSLGDWKPGRSPGQLAVAALAAVVVFGGFIALASTVFKESEPTPDDLGPRSIRASSEVVLDVTPPDATIVAELDGRILGKAPVALLVPDGGGTPVLITADGFEPQRILLPERGRMRVTLTPLEAGVACDIDLRIPGGAVVEPVAAKVEIGAKTHLPGAAVLRADGRGAWLVACPALGGSESQKLTARPPSREVELEIKGPKGANALVDGKAIGTVPGLSTVRSGFRKVRLESEGGLSVERWIPVEANTRVEMPTPRAAVDSPIAADDRPQPER